MEGRYFAKMALEGATQFNRRRTANGWQGLCALLCRLCQRLISFGISNLFDLRLQRSDLINKQDNNIKQLEALVWAETVISRHPMLRSQQLEPHCIHSKDIKECFKKMFISHSERTTSNLRSMRSHQHHSMLVFGHLRSVTSENHTHTHTQITTTTTYLLLGCFDLRTDIFHFAAAEHDGVIISNTWSLVAFLSRQGRNIHTRLR